MHLSDMVYPDGKTVNHNYSAGLKPDYSKYNLKCSSQNCQSIKAWNLWNK